MSHPPPCDALQHTVNHFGHAQCTLVMVDVLSDLLLGLGLLLCLHQRGGGGGMLDLTQVRADPHCGAHMPFISIFKAITNHIPLK